MPKKSKRTHSLSPEKIPAGAKTGESLPHPFTDILQSNVITWIASFVLLLSVLFYYASLDYDYDLWFHLKYGELYLKNQTWDINETIFSWTPVDPDWKYVTWIGSSLLYIVYQAASMQGLYGMMWLIFFVVSGLFVFYVKSIGSTFDIRHITGLMVIAAAMAPTAVIIKPELFTILFFAFAVFVYFYARSGRQNLFLAYPVLFLVWVNTHGGFIFGLFFISLILSGELFNYFLLKKDALPKSSLKRLSAAVVLSYLAILINPHGITYHSALLRYLFADTYIGVAKQLYAYSDLWQLLFADVRAYRPMVSAWSMMGMLALFLVALVHVYGKTRHFNLTLLVTNLAFFFIGMNMARASIFFPLLWIFSIVSLFKRPYSVETGKISLPAALLVLVCLSGIFFNYYAAYSSRSWFGSRMEEFIPAKETKFIQENSLPGPVLNDYLIGGYMLWSMYPEYKVFIDPRYGPYVNTVLPDWLNIKIDLSPEGLQRFTSKYPFRVALIGLEEIDIISWLLRSPEWKLAYFDKAAVVIVHQTVFHSMNPDSLKLDLGPERFRNISNPRILLQLFNLYLNLRTEYAREILGIYRNNVSGLYRFREESLYRMEQSLGAMEFRLQQIRKGKQP